MSDQGQGGGYGEHGWGDQGGEGSGGQQWGQQGQQGPQGQPPQGQWGQQGPGGQQWQQQGGYGSGQGQEDHPKTVLGFVLSLVGLVICQPVGIAGLVLGRQAKSDMERQPGRYRNEGLATAAVVIGWICVALLVLGILALIVFIAIGFSFSTTEFDTFNSIGAILS